MSDTDFEVPGEALEKLNLLFMTSEDIPFSNLVVRNISRTIRASVLSNWILERIEWNDTLYPPIDFTSPPQNTMNRISSSESTLLLTNLSKGTILIDESQCSSVGRAYIANCAETVIYVAVPLLHVSIIGCVDCEVVLMAVTGAVTVSFCEKVILRSVAAHIRLDNVIDTQLFIHTSRVPLLTGDTRGITIAPFNVVWPGHEQLLVKRTTIHPDSSHATLWSQPVCACLSESPYVLLQPAKFRVVFFPDFSSSHVKSLAVCLPQVYNDALLERQNQISDLKREILTISDETNLSKVNAIMSGHFREWLTSNNKTRVIVDLIKQKL